MWVRVALLMVVLGCGQSSTSEDSSIDADVDAEPPVCEGALAPPLRLLDRDVLGNVATEALDVVADYAALDMIPGDPFSLGPFPSAPFVETVAFEGERLLVERAAAIEASCADDAACVATEVRADVEVLFRRALVPEEVADLEAALETRTVDDVLSQALVAPDFVLLYETASGGRLSAREIAMRMSHGVWRSGPDEALVAAVEAGTVIDVLLGDARAERGLQHFHREWLEARGGGSAREASSLYVLAVFDGSATYDALIRSPFAFINSELAPLYGVPDPGAELTRVELDPSPASFFAQPSFTVGSTIADRGGRIATRVLCQQLAPAPAGIDITIGERPAGTTNRDWYESTLDEPFCFACHDTFDPYGFALEGISDEGAFRTEDEGMLVDTSFTITGVDDVSGEGIGDLMEWMASSEVAHACYARQWVRYVAQDDPPDCVVDQLGHTPGSTIPDMVAALIQNEVINARDTERPALPPFVFSAATDPGMLGAVASAAERSEAIAAGLEDGERNFVLQLRDAYRELELRLRAL